MSSPRIGIWFIGARGGVAATATLGLLAVGKQLTESTGLVSELPQFAHLDLVDWNTLVVGGHEIREGTLVGSLQRLVTESRVLEARLIDTLRPELEAIDARIRPGTLANCGPTIGSLAGSFLRDFANEPPRETIRRLQADLRSFQQEADLDRVIVVNVASTEPVGDDRSLPHGWEPLRQMLEADQASWLPASALYAIAALDLGLPYINFTPSFGSSAPAIDELAHLRGTCHAGRDGKTGETLVKSVLAPMFAARNLQVMSWVGHNIFGNLDGQVLIDPANKAAKVQSKDALVGEILGYNPQTLVSIEYIRSLGDWKTAWDHVHFRGFLGTPMTLQFTWQGCDSLLAAPLVLDLVRLVELSARRGERGLLLHLGSFFKQPLGLETHDFFRQFSLLEAWTAGQSPPQRAPRNTPPCG
jgi:myo-inositol-1-phosphate synthase